MEARSRLLKMKNSNKITSFEDLNIWQDSQKLAIKIYEITQNFPKEEIFGITNQIRRSATSISANIAEGFGRSTKKDKLHFYVIAYGSLLETKNFIYLATKLQYISRQNEKELIENTVICQKLLNAFMRPLRA